MRKSGALAYLINAYDADVVCLTEIWLSDTIRDHEFCLPMCSAFRKDRKEQRGGDVAIPAKNSLSFAYLNHIIMVVPHRRNKSNLSDATGVEAIFGKLRSSDTECVLGSVYRPPGGFPLGTGFLDAYLSENLTGDFNPPNINWVYFSVLNNDVNPDALLDLTINYNAAQVVEEASRVQGKSRNVLDLTFLNKRLSSTNYSIEVMERTPYHCAAVLTLNCCDFVQKGVVSKMLDFNSADDCSNVDELPCRLHDFQLAVE